MTEFTIIKKISCNNSLKCSDNIRTKLEEKFNIKLMARDEKDSVNGFISIVHEENNHTILIGLYDKNEEPSSKHQTTFKKLSKFPTQKQCEDCLK
jgi:hypothetical protein